MQPQGNMSLQTPDEKQMGLFLHLSGLAQLLFFPIGIALPIILWQTQKDKMPALDAHGKMVANFVISLSIYLMVSAFSMILLIGFLLLPVVAIGGAVLSVMGALKANNGEFYEYPLTIKFIK